MIEHTATVLKSIVVIAYAVAAAGYVFCFARDRDRPFTWLLPAVLTGLAAHATILGAMLWHEGNVVLGSSFEGLTLSALVIVGASSILTYVKRESSFAAFLTPFGLVLTLIAFAHTDHSPYISPIAQMANSSALKGLLYSSYAFFVLSATASVMYLVQHRQIRNRSLGSVYERLPALDVMNQVVTRADAIGTALLISAVVLGFMRLASHGPVPPGFNVKIALALLAALAYACEHLLRMGKGWEGQRACVISLAGFVLVQTALLAGHHGF